MRRVLVAMVLIALFPGLASAGGGGGSLCPGFSSGETVSMLDSCFSGVAHFASSETTVTVRNDGLLPHTITAVDGSFDSGLIQAGAVFDLDLDPGVYKVFCTLHGTAEGNGMAGVLIVGDESTTSGSAAPAVSPPPTSAASSSQSSQGLWFVVLAVAGAVAVSLGLRRLPVRRPEVTLTPPSR